MTIIDTSLVDFDQDGLAASFERPILVDFQADWCAPCRVIAPVLQHVYDTLNGSVGMVKLEVDQGENMKLAGHYRVRGFPTIMLFDQGQETGRFSGAKSRGQIFSFIDQHSTGLNRPGSVQ